MKLPNAEIEQAVPPKQSRFTINSVLLDVESKRLIATDGHILASIPAELDADDHRGLIPAEALRQARKMTKSAKADAKIAVNGKVTVTAGTAQVTFDQETGNFPRHDQVFAEINTNGPATITLNVDLLLRLAKALDCRDAYDKRHKKDRIVSLWIKDAQSSVGVKVSGSGNEEALGVIMPCRP